MNNINNNNNVIFHSAISSIQKVALYETKTVSYCKEIENWLYCYKIMIDFLAWQYNSICYFLSETILSWQ